MHKKTFILFAFLLIFFLVVSGMTNLQHIIIGAFLGLLTIWFWKDFTPLLPGISSFKELLLLIRSIVMLVGYVIQSNINVAKILLFSDLSTGSVFLELKPDIKSNWGRVFLATCITITPGTITIDIDPETNVFTIHALTVEIGRDLYYWRVITEIKKLETLVLRREDYGLDTDGVHGSDPISTIESNHRAHGN